MSSMSADLTRFAGTSQMTTLLRAKVIRAEFLEGRGS